MDERHLRALHSRISTVLDDGPRAIDDLAADIEEHGLAAPFGVPADEVGDWLTEVLEETDGVWISSRDVIARLDVLLSQSVFTHRVTQSELDRGMLDAHPDFAPLAWDELRPLRLGSDVLDITEAAVDEGAAESGSLIGPEGWLAGFEPGDLVAVWCVGDEARVERVDEPVPGEAEVAALHSAFLLEGSGDPDDRADDDAGDVLGDMTAAIVFDAMCADPELFRRPVRPLGELLADAGLEHRDEWCGPAGLDWLPSAVADMADELEVIAHRYDLDHCCLEHLDDAMQAWNALVTTTDPTAAVERIDWGAAAAALAHGFVAAAFADLVLAGRDEPPARFDDFVTALTRADASLFAGMTGYLTARKLELVGETLAAESALQVATTADPHYEPAVEDLAWYAADRGDAERAVLLMRRAGYDTDDAELRFVSSMRARRNAVGRNERCPCGSGRKYKDCCARNPRLPLAERAEWLLHKLYRFVLRPQRQHVVLGITAVVAGDEHSFDAVFDSGVPLDLAAFEGGIAREFLAERGILLPDDERALLESWIAQPRALYEVTDSTDSTESAEVANGSPERALVLRDTSGTATVTVTAPADEDQRPGALVYARVAVVDGRHRFVGTPLQAPADARSEIEELVASEPTALQIAAWFGDVIALQ